MYVYWGVCMLVTAGLKIPADKMPVRLCTSWNAILCAIQQVSLWEHSGHFVCAAGLEILRYTDDYASVHMSSVS